MIQYQTIGETPVLPTHRTMQVLHVPTKRTGTIHHANAAGVWVDIAGCVARINVLDLEWVETPEVEPALVGINETEA